MWRKFSFNTEFTGDWLPLSTHDLKFMKVHYYFRIVFMDICSIKNVTIPIKSSSNVLMWASGKTPALLLFIQDLLQQVYLKGSFSYYVRKIFKKTPQKQHFFSCDTHTYVLVSRGKKCYYRQQCCVRMISWRY